MAQKRRPVRARKARTFPAIVRQLGAFALVAVVYGGTVTAIRNPEPDIRASLMQAELPASLSYAGTDVTITGSVDHMFEGMTFSGPNRAAKVNRQFPKAEAVEVAAAFDELRDKMAELRRRETLGAVVDEDEPQLSVASLVSDLGSSALEAIRSVDATTPESGEPLPVSLPTQLAYARANTPATVFETPVSKKLSSKEMWCLATAIYFEARGESYRGQVGVAQVVMNRVNHPLYPNTVCGVVFQNQHIRNACQFSFACDGIPERVTEKDPWDQAEEIAERVTNGSIYLTEVDNATHYHANYVYPRWAPRMKKMTQIGLHIFYRFKNNWVGT